MEGLRVTAAGATPRFAAAVLLAEHVVLALVSALAGLAAGWLVAPLLTSPRAWWLLALVGGVVVATVAVAAVPASAGARRPVTELLAEEG